MIQQERALAPAKALAAQLQLKAEIHRLLPQDFAVIRSYLVQCREMKPSARIALSRQLAYQVQEIIHWENILGGITPTLFLEAAAM